MRRPGLHRAGVQQCAEVSEPMCTSVLSLRSYAARQGALMVAFLLEMRQKPTWANMDMGMDMGMGMGMAWWPWPCSGPRGPLIL